MQFVADVAVCPACVSLCLLNCSDVPHPQSAPLQCLRSARTACNRPIPNLDCPMMSARCPHAQVYQGAVQASRSPKGEGGPVLRRPAVQVTRRAAGTRGAPGRSAGHQGHGGPGPLQHRRGGQQPGHLPGARPEPDVPLEGAPPPPFPRHAARCAAPAPVAPASLRACAALRELAVCACRKAAHAGCVGHPVLLVPCLQAQTRR